MGSLCSLILPNVDQNQARIVALKERFHLTNMDVQALYKTFKRVDKDHSGVVDFTEFFDFVQEPHKEALSMMFRLMTHSHHTEEELDFPAWMQAVIGFCVLTPEEVCDSVYIMHDADRNGFIDIAELTAMLKNLHSENHIYPSQLTASIVKNYILEDGKLDYEEFQRICQTHPMLLWPIYRTQHRMRKKLLGEKLWNRIDSKLDDIYTYNLLEKGGKEPGFVQTVTEKCDLYCCTILGCYDSQKVLQCEVEAGEAAKDYRRALGEFEHPPELVKWELEQKEREERQKKKEKPQVATDEDSSDVSTEMSEIVIKDDDAEYGQTEEHKKAIAEFQKKLDEKKEKEREERRHNPRYLDQDHFDSEWYDYSDELKDLGDLSVAGDEFKDSRKLADE